MSSKEEKKKHSWKYIVVLVVVAVAVVTAEQLAINSLFSPNPTGTTWVTFQSQQEKFSVSFPYQPVLSTDNTLKDVMTFKYTSSANGVLYTMSCSDSYYMLKNSTKDLIDTATSGASSVGGTLSNQTIISLNGIQGIQFTESLGGAFMKTRIFIVGHRLYIVDATGSKDDIESSNATHFLDSFRLMT